MSWQAIAEHAARARCAEVLERMQRTIAAHGPDLRVEAGGDELRVRARGLKQRWLGEPSLRFARRIIL